MVRFNKLLFSNAEDALLFHLKNDTANKIQPPLSNCKTKLRKSNRAQPNLNNGFCHRQIPKCSKNWQRFNVNNFLCLYWFPYFQNSKVQDYYIILLLLYYYYIDIILILGSFVNSESCSYSEIMLYVGFQLWNLIVCLENIKSSDFSWTCRPN